MTTFRNALRVALLAALGAAFVALAAPEPQEAKTDKTEKKKADITVAFKIIAEGENSISPSSQVLFKGLDNCGEPSQVTRMNKEGEGTFKSPPQCIVELKILLPPPWPTRIALVDISKYRGSPVRIEIKKLSGHVTVTIPGPTPPAVSPTSSVAR